MNELPAKCKVIVDSREKRPLFKVGPGDSFIDEYVLDKVEGGDYTIKEIPNFIIIERKADCAELFNTVVLNKERFQRQLEKMLQYEHRFIVIQQTYKDFIDPSKWTFIRNFKTRLRYIATTEAWLISLQYKHNIHFLFLDPIQSPRFIRRLLGKYYEYAKKRTKRIIQQAIPTDFSGGESEDGDEVDL